MKMEFCSDKTNDGVIGLIKTPGYWISEKAEEINITTIKITYGGGMGGANKIYYCDEINIDNVQPNNFIKVKDLINNEITIINTKYIVYMNNEYKLAKAKFYSDNGGFNNSWLGEWTIYKLLKRDVTVELINEFKTFK